MEFVSPGLVMNDNKPAFEGENLLSYRELRSLRPVKVDNSLNLLDAEEDSSLFDRYIKDKLRLIPILRSNPLFKPRPDFPSRVLLEMTSRCNLSCTMCPRQSLTRTIIDMEPAIFKKCVNELDKDKIDGLWLYNIGESILHPEFSTLLDYVSAKKDLGPVWLSSNGQGLNEYFSNIIINSKTVFMNMSVNATTPETYKKISPEADWGKMLSNFERFIDLKRKSGKRTPFTRVQIIDQKFAREEIDDFLKIYTSRADIMAVNNLEAFSKDVSSNLEYAERRKRPEGKNCNRIYRQDLFIFSNGETTFCDTDFNGTLSMGNVKDKSIHEIWNSDCRKRMIELNRVGRLNAVDLCRNCLDFDL